LGAIVTRLAMGFDEGKLANRGRPLPGREPSDRCVGRSGQGFELRTRAAALRWVGWGSDIGQTRFAKIP